MAATSGSGGSSRTELLVPSPQSSGSSDNASDDWRLRTTTDDWGLDCVTHHCLSFPFGYLIVVPRCSGAFSQRRGIMFGLGNRNRGRRVRNDTFSGSRIRNAALAGVGMLAWRWWRNRQGNAARPPPTRTGLSPTARVAQPGHSNTPGHLECTRGGGANVLHHHLFVWVASSRQSPVASSQFRRLRAGD